MNEWKRSLLTGTIVALASQLYWNVFVSGFRISPAVILLPILLMTIGKSISTIRITVTTAAVVFLFRLFLAASGLSSSPETAGQLATNSIFYLCYGLLFSVLVPSKPTVSYRRLFPSVFLCDLLSNLLEVCIFESGRSGTLSPSMAGYLILVAVFRTLLACLFLAAESQYRTLLKKEEHENRYRRLFLMTTGLKNEIYFMKKNSEEIESVMSNAYRLYERLSAMDVPDDMKKMSLSIARDVHEIKKDYIRIIQGIEQEISEEYDEKQMSFQDLLQILEATTYHILETRPVHIRLVFQCSDNFITREHYE
uniref:histidine kinase n=1 Tax=Alitiscatomonas sp. TaxID=2981647 RepID=UPI0030787CBB